MGSGAEKQASPCLPTSAGGVWESASSFISWLARVLNPILLSPPPLSPQPDVRSGNPSCSTIPAPQPKSSSESPPSELFLWSPLQPSPGPPTQQSRRFSRRVSPLRRRDFLQLRPRQLQCLLHAINFAPCLPGAVGPLLPLDTADAHANAHARPTRAPCQRASPPSLSSRHRQRSNRASGRKRGPRIPAITPSLPLSYFQILEPRLPRLLLCPRPVGEDEARLRLWRRLHAPFPSSSRPDH